MKFSKNKFDSFSEERKKKKILQFLRHIEEVWNVDYKRVELSSNLFDIANYYPCLYKLLTNKKNDLKTKRNFTGLLAEWEKKCRIDVRDHDIFIEKEDGVRERVQIPLSIIVDNLRSAFNVGSIFRIAECLGIDKLYLCGYTPTPKNDKVVKTAMGTVGFVDWSSFEKTEDAIKNVQEKGVHVIALETVDKAKTIYSKRFPKPCALLIGNEALGISEDLLIQVNDIVRIPVNGWKNSLNVGVATSITGYEILRQWNIEGGNGD